MTIREAIQKANNLKPSQYRDEIMVGWLSDLDGQMWQDVLCHYAEKGQPAPAPYDPDQDMDKQLLAERPHEELYMTWLGAKIDYYNGEYERYNNAMMMFNAQLEAFYNAYNRTHMHRQDACIQI